MSNYKISGSVVQTTRVIVINESDWTAESNTIENGNYEIEVDFGGGTKTILGRLPSGQSTGFGNVEPIPIPPTVIYDRGVFIGGDIPSPLSTPDDTMDYITISTPGDATDFGNLITATYLMAACSNGSSDRGVIGGGRTSSAEVNTIEYITITTPGGSTNFGDLTSTKRGMDSVSNGIEDRGIFAGGYPSTNVIEYITISTIADAQDFGDLTQSRRNGAPISNGIGNRGVFAGGIDEESYNANSMEYITIATAGNAVDFGDLSVGRQSPDGTDNGTNNRGLIGGGHNSGSGGAQIGIEYITITTLSNAQSFGDLTVARRTLTSTSNSTNNRGIFAGGWDTDVTNVIDYVTISSPGNATNFGDLTVSREDLTATSNA